MTTLFRCARQSQNYANFRPTYRTELFERIANSVECERTNAVDVGCGNGQATVSLADYFEHVTGIDPSPSQLENAKQHPRVSYQVGQSDALRFPDNSLSCITSAQAAHWFDIPKFYQECNRTLQVGGVVGLWTYSHMHTHDKHLERLIWHDFYEVALGPYFDERRRIVENQYRDLPLISDLYDNFSSERIHDYDICKDMQYHELLGFLRSWSAYTKYTTANQIEQGSDDDPVRPIAEYMDEQKMTTIPTEWPVCLLLSVKER